MAAARVVTGATLNYSTRLLYEETKWEKLDIRREKHKLIHFCKILHGLTPEYLTDIFPELLPTGHNTRTSGEISLLF